MGTADERTGNDEWMFLSCGAAGVAGGGIMCNGARGRSREVHSAGCSFIGTQGGEGGGGTLEAAAGSGLSWADRLAQLRGSSWAVDGGTAALCCACCAHWRSADTRCRRPCAARISSSGGTLTVPLSAPLPLPLPFT